VPSSWSAASLFGKVFDSCAPRTSHPCHADHVLSLRIVRIIEGLAEDWRRLDEWIDHFSDEIAALARQDAGCERLVSVPGVGPIIQRYGGGNLQNAFSKGPDFAARLDDRFQDSNHRERPKMLQSCVLRPRPQLIGFMDSLD